MIKSYRLFLVSAFLITGCMTDSSQSDRTIVSGLYTNSAIGLTMAFPTAWQIKTDQVYGGTTMDIQALGAPINNFSPNVSVIITAHSGPTTMAAILPDIKGQLVARFTDLSKYSDTIYTIGAKEIGKMQYETTMSGTLFHFAQIYFINNAKDVSLTFTDRADDFLVNPDLRGIMASIAVK